MKNSNSMSELYKNLHYYVKQVMSLKTSDPVVNPEGVEDRGFAWTHLWDQIVSF